ncbi:MAG: serine/threonine protein kinase [Polyangiaceae bacterium]|nr:serine/threonine protein kinase [Polyangiaceae bacterium]
MALNTNRSRSDLRAGDRVGDYLVQGALASGGFGAVYRVAHAATQKPAALKVLHADLVSTTTAVLRFEREVEVIRRIRHPNVVDIFEAGTLDDGRPYFVMELLSGVSLEAFVRVRKRLPPADVLGVLEPLCKTLAVCHEQSVIHRDLKASNIFLAETALGTRRVTLLDFGVAKLIDDSAPGLTAPSRIVGTPTCMAPEQIRGEPATARTDIYALGVLSYFMLTGELPFKDPSFMLMQSMHLYVNPEKPSTVAPVSATFDDVVLRAMAKSPENRFASTLDMLAAFRAALESERRPRDVASKARAIALHVEVDVSPDALEQPDEALYTDMEAVLPIAARTLGNRGFRIMLWAGNRMVLVSNLPEHPDLERAHRMDAVHAALLLLGELAARSSRDERVRVRVRLDVGAATAPGEEIDEEIIDVSWGAPDEDSLESLLASAQALDGLSVETRPVDGSNRLLRVLETAPA